MVKKSPTCGFVRGFCTFLAIMGLFCVLTGCSFSFRHASEPDPFFETRAPETEIDTETAQADTDGPETEEPETQKVTEQETEETMIPETVVNFENTPSEEAKKWITLYESKGDPTAVLLSEAEIDALNERIRTDCPTMHHMGDIPTDLPGASVADWINASRIPASAHADKDGNPITQAQLDALEANRNLSALPDLVIPQTAIVTKRTNVRTVPTDARFYSNTDTNRYFDRLQEAELILGTPVLLLHQSLDGAFFFVQSYYYRGWVKASDLALSDEENYRKILPENLVEGVTVISDTLTLEDGTKLDMGARFPYVSSDADHFTITIPRRDGNGILFWETASVSKKDTYYGRLPYTVENTITQAFKFLGTDYSWGGYNEGVDCSGFICAVFRSFGIYLPRNTGAQKEYGGTITPLAGLDQDSVKKELDSLTHPAAIHRPGHVMLYLGIDDGKIYVIHAPSGGQQVSVMLLSKTDNLICAASIK